MYEIDDALMFKPRVNEPIMREILRQPIAALRGRNWPDTYRVNRYVRGNASIRNADDALRGFTRFPTWMWRNTAVMEFID